MEDIVSNNRKNHLSTSAVEYTIRCILEFAGIPSEKAVISGSNARIGAKQLRFALSDFETQECLFQGNAHISYMPSFDGDVEIPLFDSASFAEWVGDTLYIYADILTISFALLSRYEETLTDERDQYNRFSYHNSLSAKYGFIGLPLVDEYAMLIRKQLENHGCPELKEKRKPRIVPTHDVDELWRFQSWIKAVKSILGGDILIRKSWRTACCSIRQVLYSRCMPEKDPRYLDCFKLMQVSKENGMNSTFFFLDYEDGADWQYSVTHPSVSKLMKDLKQMGATVGIHGGIGSSSDYEAFRRQKNCIDHVNGQPVRVGRQHFLYFDALQTPPVWEKSGLKEDETLSFFDHEGFRCGTCHTYPLYDLKADHPLNVYERPLLLMDGTVQHYRKLTIEQALEAARKIRNRVFAVGGDFVILWHNSSLDRGMEYWYQNFYIPWIQESGMILSSGYLEEPDDK